MVDITVQIIFHIGQQKTASSTIQAYLAWNRKRLAAQQILYPTALGNQKADLTSALLVDRQDMSERTGHIIRNVKAEFSGRYQKAIVSNENLFLIRSSKSARLKSLLEPYATSWRVLSYVRRPDEHIVSDYQQRVKGGYLGTFDQFFGERLQSNFYNNASHLEQWSSVFGQSAVEVRLFKREALKGRLLDDFAQWVGIDTKRLSDPITERANESLDPLNTEILRFFAVCQIERPELVREYNVRRLIARLRAADSGERLRLDGERARLLHNRFRREHEQLAERYLSSEDAALLLAPPTEVAPPPPFNQKALFERMMDLFSDRNLAQFAIDMTARPYKTAENASRLGKGTKVERITQRQERHAKSRTWHARAIRALRDYWRSAPWVRRGSK